MTKGANRTRTIVAEKYVRMRAEYRSLSHISRSRTDVRRVRTSLIPSESTVADCSTVSVISPDTSALSADAARYAAIVRRRYLRITKTRGTNERTTTKPTRHSMTSAATTVTITWNDSTMSRERPRRKMNSTRLTSEVVRPRRSPVPAASTTDSGKCITDSTIRMRNTLNTF